VLAAACLLSVVCARVAITGLVLSPAEVIGSLAGAVCWAALFYRLRLRMPIIAALLASMIAAQSLEPFRFLAVARPFGWAPFRGMMQGSISVNIVSLFEKSFAYGALVWFLQRSGWRLWLAATASAAFVLVLSVAQVYIPGRSAEITDAVIVLLMAGLIALLQPRTEANGRSSSAR
jgi:hypothetical protein